ncbi:MAG: PD40 domain-containing protein [Candidatus Delongbacteria bacterium]|nr:PD40 domain-containing protein [Candidatus Delongbacteria bacterium]MBN2834346.1 PD40 domain-containing protein [Candidatus Delongbacteria bacterium]
MTIRISVCLLLFTLLSSLQSSQSQIDSKISLSKLRGEYFGQTKPELIPDIFMDKVISGKGHTHGSVTFTPNLDEVYWDERIDENSFHRIYYSKCVDNLWTAPEIVEFIKNMDADSPVLSPDGNKLFFNSRWTKNDGPVSGKERIWFIERDKNGNWTSLNLVCDAINNEPLHWQVSVDSSGNLFFGSERKGSLGEDDIFCSLLVDDKYQTPINLGQAVNSSLHESTPCIAADGSYLLFTRIVNKKDCFFISVRNEDKTWQEPINITNLYPDIFGTCPKISPDNKYIFFNRYENRTANVYWVSINILNEILRD